MDSKVGIDALVWNPEPPYFFVKYVLLCGQTRASVPTCNTISHRTNNSFTCLLLHSSTQTNHNFEL